MWLSLNRSGWAEPFPFAAGRSQQVEERAQRLGVNGRRNLARASASRSGPVHWASGSTTSSTYSRPAGTRPPSFDITSEPSRSSALGSISRGSRRPRWRAPRRPHGRVAAVAGGVRLLAAYGDSTCRPTSRCAAPSVSPCDRKRVSCRISSSISNGATPTPGSRSWPSSGPRQAPRASTRDG